MTADEEKKEVIVKAPAKPVVSPEKKAERTAEKSLEEERYDILQVTTKFGAYFGVAVMCIGFFLLSLFAYVGTTGQEGLLVLSSVAPAFSAALWIFVGLLTVIAGLLLIGNEG